jgi:hypothetical protein
MESCAGELCLEQCTAQQAADVFASGMVYYRHVV